MLSGPDLMIKPYLFIIIVKTLIYERRIIKYRNLTFIKRLNLVLVLGIRNYLSVILYRRMSNIWFSH